MIIRNGLVYDPLDIPGGKKLDILIESGIILKIAESIEIGDQEIFDASGLSVVPGLIDMHAHLREPGQEHKETIETGSLSAAAGGITTVLAMPNTIPAIDSSERIQDFYSRAMEKSVIELYTACAMTRDRKGKEAVDFDAAREAGCLAFSDDGSSIQNFDVMLSVCTAAKKSASLLIEHPEVAALMNGEPSSYGKTAALLGKTGQPSEAESAAILALGTIAGMSGARVHFTHVSTAKSLEAVRYLKKIYPGLVTCDCTPHHLILSEEDLLREAEGSPEKLNPDKKMNPPLRPEKDRASVENALTDGTADCIATDHAPHSQDEKSTGFLKAPFGSVGFETLLAATYTRLAASGRMRFSEWLKLITVNPAKILGLDRGRIRTGGRADLALFNPDELWTVRKEKLLSKSKNTPFEGMEFQGRVKLTLCGGRIVYRETNLL